jgi:2,3-bisphosphoglycerate-dependent phosphoglycerate mutase/probable phosphoglycerate mutase
MELYLIRHAQSTNNALADQRQRVMDPELTPLGLRQAALLAERLATVLKPLAVPAGTSGNGPGPVAESRRLRLYCSPMWRSLQTAHFISEALGVEPEVWIEIHEHGGIFLDHGEPQGIVGYPGKSRDEILAHFPTCVLPEGITAEGWWRGGFEDIEGCYARAVQVAEALRDRAAGDEVLLLVSHGTFMDALLKALLDQPLRSNFYYGHNNTGITHLEFTPSGWLLVRYQNRLDHLPAELIS